MKTCGECAWSTVIRDYGDGEIIIGCRRTGWSFRHGSTINYDSQEHMDPSNIYRSTERACPAFQPVEVGQ